MRIALALAASLVWGASAAVGQSLPGNSADISFDAVARSLNLEDSTLEFHYKAGRHQGSTVGFHVSEPGHRKSGTFAPQNTSNNLESEIVAYRLARFLGISDIYNPVTYYTLGPIAAQRFRDMLKKKGESDPDRRINQNTTLAALSANPKTLPGLYRFRPRGNHFVVASLTTGQGHLNSGHPLASFIRANGPVPSDKPMSFSGVKGARDGFPPKPKEKESELARQLSDILLVDQLLGQWDRFFNNIEAFGDASGRLQFFARDNGGGTVNDWEWYNLYDQWVSRYDRDVTQRLGELHAFLHGKQTSFAGFDDPEAWKRAVGFLRDSSFSTFKRKLDILVEKRLPDLEKQYGAKTYFALPAMSVAFSLGSAPSTDMSPTDGAVQTRGSQAPTAATATQTPALPAAVEPAKPLVAAARKPAPRRRPSADDDDANESAPNKPSRYRSSSECKFPCIGHSD